MQKLTNRVIYHVSAQLIMHLTLLTKEKEEERA